MKRRPETLLLDFVIDTYLLENAVSDKYGKLLQTSVRVYSAFLNRPATLLDLNRHSINAFLDRYGQSVVPETVVGKRANLLRLWQYAYDLGLVKDPPERRRIRRPRIPRSSPTAWRLDELALLLVAAATMLGACPVYGFAWADFFVAFINLKYDIAIRFGDMLRIRVEQIAGDSIAVTQNKNGEVNFLPLRAETVRAIRRIVDGFPDRTLLFAWPRKRDKFWKRFRRIVETAGIRRGGTKWLRRSSASYIERDHPGSARRHLGHLTDSMWRRYVDPTIAYAAPPLPPTIPLAIFDPTDPSAHGLDPETS
jgi:integrase